MQVVKTFPSNLIQAIQLLGKFMNIKKDASILTVNCSYKRN